MTNLRSQKLSFKPTTRIMEAIDDLTIKLRSTQEYSGKWLPADTIRYLISKSYVEHNYPTKIRRVTVRSVNMSEEEVNNLSPMIDEDNGSKCAWIFRLLVSGLIQEGYLDTDTTEAIIPKRQFRDRKPRKYTEEISV